MVYYEALDLATTSITERFDQPGYKVYQNLETLVLKVCRGEKYDEHLDFVCEFYGEDFDKDLLKVQLSLFHTLVTEGDQCKDSDLTIHNIVRVLANLSIGQQVALSQIFILMKLLLVMPATNATSERSFSALRRIKSYLRATMSQERLNSLLTLHIHKENTLKLNLADIGSDFVSAKENRTTMFGKF